MLLLYFFISDLRRSPRIKTLARRHSNVFYSSSQPRSRNLDRALSASQLSAANVKKTVRSPMSLLFGAAESSSGQSDQSCGTRLTRSRLSTDSSVFEVSYCVCVCVCIAKDHQNFSSPIELSFDLFYTHIENLLLVLQCF